MPIAEVAKVAGVSEATVSRVINDRPGVSPAVIDLVRGAMSKLNYTPKPLHRRPGRRVHQTNGPTAPPRSLGVVVLDNLYTYTPGTFAAHLRGIDAEATEHGLAVFLTHASTTAELPSVITSDAVSGLILLGSRGKPEVLKKLDRIPSVWLSSHHGANGDLVLAGNTAISQLAARYLNRRGHKHVAFLAVMSSYPAYPARADAFAFAASQAGMTASLLMDSPENDGQIAFPELGVLQERMKAVVDRLVQLAPRPTGLFVANDMQAAMAYTALRRAGLQPGKDVDVVSCNNELSYLIGLDPRPATIDIGSEMIGRRSVEQLLRHIRRPDETRQVQVAILPVLVEPPTE